MSIRIGNRIIASNLGTKSTDYYGIKGDYATRYGIISCPNGLITTSVGTTEIKVQPGIQLLMPSDDIITTIGSLIKYTIKSVENTTLFITEGSILEAEDVFYQDEEPMDGTHSYAAWFSPKIGEWQFKSNDTGNVWRAAKATPIADICIREGNITRVDYIGYRVLNNEIFQDKANLAQIVDNSETLYPSNKAVSLAIAQSQAVPPQAGNAGKFLSTDGDKASWETVDLSSKQDTLSTTQLSAVNSGITTDKVVIYDGYQEQLDGKQPAGEYATKTYVDDLLGNVETRINGI